MVWHADLVVDDGRGRLRVLVDPRYQHRCEAGYDYGLGGEAVAAR